MTRVAALAVAMVVLLGCSSPATTDSELAALKSDVQSLTEMVSSLDGKLDRVCALLHKATDERSTYYPPGSECN